MMIRTIRYIFFLFTVTCIAGGLWANENAGSQFVSKTDTAIVNWTERVLKAVGRGEPPEAYFGDEQGRKIALATAIESARSELMTAIARIPIDAESKVGDLVKRDLVALEEMVDMAEVVHQEFTTDGTVEVTVQMSMNGGFSQLVLPKVIEQIESVKPITDTSINPLVRDTEGFSATGDVLSGPYTGMIIDARGLDVTPCMAPRVYDENGQEVFGPAYASREYAVQRGMTGYVSDMNAAIQNSRVAGHPLRLIGLRAEGTGGTNIIVSNSDAARLRSDSESLTFRRQCRVMIVLDAHDAGKDG